MKTMSLELRILAAVVCTFMYALVLSAMFPGSPITQSSSKLIEMWSNTTPDMVWGLRIVTSVAWVCLTIWIWRKIVFNK